MRWLMDVAVVAVGGFGAVGHLFHGHDAAHKPLAAGVLELDGGVADLEVLPENSG